LFELLKINGCT